MTPGLKPSELNLRATPQRKDEDDEGMVEAESTPSPSRTF
jgi:hypothetical protein